MSSEPTQYELPVKTTAIIWTFKPIYNGTPTKIEWVIEYSIDYGLLESGYDSGMVKYAMYNNNTSTWDDLSINGHHGFNYNVADEAFFGNRTPQLYYSIVTTNPSYYINDSGKVEVKMYWDYSTSTIESEIHWDGSSIQQYIARKSNLTVTYNGLFVS